jgi:hypothetical protein
MRVATWILSCLALVVAVPTLWIVWGPAPDDGGTLLIMIVLAFLLFCLAFPGAVLGLVGWRRARKDGGPRNGATAAFVVSTFALASALVLDGFVAAVFRN